MGRKEETLMKKKRIQLIVLIIICLLSIGAYIFSSSILI